MVHFCSKKYQAKSEKEQATIQVHAKWAVQYKYNTSTIQVQYKYNTSYNTSTIQVQYKLGYK